MMKKACALAVLLSLPIFALAQEEINRYGLRIDRSKRRVALAGDEIAAMINPSVKPHTGRVAGALGPGKFLMTSWYDYGSNGGVLSNIVDYGDGTLAVARMGAQQQDAADRGTFWSFSNGVSWAPMAKVELLRRGWSNLAALPDGRSVTVSHIANEVNVDQSKGAGTWTSSITNFATAVRAIWPRLTVDGRGNIIVCSTLDGTQDGIQNRKEVAISRDGGATWSHQILLPDTSKRVPVFSSDDQAIDSFGDKIAIAVAEFAGDIHLWESTDNGATWDYRNLTNYPDDIPLDIEESRPWSTCDLIYDNNGNLHVFWEGLLAVQDNPGTVIELFYSRSVGIQHWSEATGISQVAAWADIPGAELESDGELFAAGNPFNQINANNTLVAQPQAGVDDAGNLYVLFAAYRPLDFDTDFTHFTDIYVVGSSNDGATWGPPVNVTDTPQSEDLWASLADNVGDSLRLVYQSDDNTGNSVQGGGAAPTTLLYQAFDKKQIPFNRLGEIIISISSALTGAPNSIVDVPIFLTFADTSIAALGAAVKATNGILSFTGFTPGPIVPGATFDVYAVAPDSIRLAFVDFGGGPIAQEGLLATLHFKINPLAAEREISVLTFSDLSASDPNFNSLPLLATRGKVTVMIQPAEIRGMKWRDQNANGVKDAGEPGLGGWQINLTGAAVLSTTTDSLGSYSFKTLAPGTYTVSEVLRNGWRQTFPPAPGTYTVNLASGQVVDTLNFGNEPPTAVEESDEVALPETFVLFQNHPNPFNPATTIKYGIPRRSRVRIEVFDMLGKRVALLTDAIQPAGYHQVTFNSAGLSSGIYFYSLTATGVVETKKMLLLR
jgi:hypothetical protein